MSLLGNATHVDGFRKEYYIRVQFNFIERGIYDQSQYKDLYIKEITTDPTMKSSCQCCSDEKEGKIQHIMYKFHVRNRQDPNFEMIIGSTCIEQFKGIDPDMLRHALLKFEQEKKNVDKLRRKHAKEDRIVEYKTKYATFINYLDKLYKLKRGYSNQWIYVTVKDKHDNDVQEKTSIYELYQILVEGKKIFREHHELAFAQMVAKLPLDEIEQKLAEREAQKNNGMSFAENWRREREEEHIKRQQEQQLRLEREQDIEFVKSLQVRYPNDTYLPHVLGLLESGENLIPQQRDILESMKSQPVAKATLKEEIEGYLASVDNGYMKNMLGLLKRNITLTDNQLNKIREVLDGLAGFEVKYKKESDLLEQIGGMNLAATHQAKHAELLSTYTKARVFNKFFNEKLETSWLKGVEDLAKIANLVTV